MPSSQSNFSSSSSSASSSSSSSPYKKYTRHTMPAITKIIASRVSKKRKPALSPKSPSVISPNRLLRRPNSKRLAALLRGIQEVEKRDLLGHCGRAEAKPITTKAKNAKLTAPSIKDKIISGGISKKKKKRNSVLSPKSPLAVTPDRFLRRPKSKQLVSLRRGIQALMEETATGYCGPAQPEPMDIGSVDTAQPEPMDIVSVDHAQPEPMDTREDYEWTYPGFDGYLLQELANKRGKFPEMQLSAENLILYYLGEINEDGIA